MLLHRSDKSKRKVSLNLNAEHTPLAYIMSRFPKVTETFILREILELREQGQSIYIYPLIEIKEDIKHSEVSKLIPNTYFTPLLSKEIILANLHYLIYTPLKYLSTLWSTVGGNLGSANLFFGGLAIFPKSAYLARLIEKKGIGHVHAHFATHPAMAAYIISDLTGITFSFTVHAHDIFVHKKMLDQKLRNASFVVAISQYNKQYLKGMFPDIDTSRIKVIHCGVNMENYRQVNKDNGYKFKNLNPQRTDTTDSGEFNILSVASLQKYKGLHVLIKACQILNKHKEDFKCFIIGEGEERNNLKELISESNLEDKVMLLGYKTQIEVASMMKKCDIFVLPSIIAKNGQMEGIPVALMEAMASGLPVIASELSGIPELVEDGINGLLVSGGDVDELAEAIQTLKYDEKERKRMGQRGCKRIYSDFEIKKNVSKLNLLFNKVLNEDSKYLPFDPCLLSSLKKAVLKNCPDCKNSEKELFLSVQEVYSGKDCMVYDVLVQENEHFFKKLILKIHRSSINSDQSRIVPSLRHSSNEFRTLRFLWEQFSKQSKTLSVPHPEEHFPEFGAILMEKCEGIRFDQSLRWAIFIASKYQKSRISQNARACGEWLAMFHSITEKLGDLATIYQRIEREFLDDLKKCFEIGLNRKLVDGVARIFEEKKSLVFNSKHTIVGHHCDFGTYNVFISSNGVTVIDFEGMRDGIIYDDICYFLGMIDSFPSYHLSSGLCKRIKESFLEGYSNYDKIEQEEFDLFMLITMVKIMARNPVFREINNTLRSRIIHHQKFKVFSNWFEEQLG